jgi:leucyl aminopeptidase
MKDIITVEVKTRKVDFTKCQTELLAVGVFAEAQRLDQLNRELNGKLDGEISRLLELGDFKAKEATSAVLYGNGRIAARRLLLVGLGEKKKATLDTLRKAAAHTANKAITMKVENISLAIHKAFGGRFEPETTGQVMAEGAFYGSYRYDEYVTGGDDDGRLARLNVELVDCDSVKTRKLDSGLSKGAVIGSAQSYARTLSNRPGNVINPPALADEAKKMAKATAGLTCTVLDEKQLAAKGMGGVLAVGSGSKTGPRFIVLKYEPAGKKAQRLPTIALVGKAITFDSGGLSIKPAAHMDHMKLDKSGGIAVLATMKAAAQLKLPLNVYGIIPSAENMPGGSSYRPGDIITTFSGKTVEVQNTDAEGRMVLCDALTYAVKQGCDIIIDIATLTGACMVALGRYMAGLMSNDDKLLKQLQKAAEQSGEKVWHMPSGDEYAEEMKSKIADLKNIGSKWGGACTAAAFLKQFVEEKKWAHLDMAGVDVFESDKNSGGTGSTGFGVRLLTTYLINAVKKK